MRKIKATKILEIIILITIIISIILIILIAKKTLTQSPKPSNSNEINNYSVTSYYKFNKEITESSKYKIPFQEYISNESTYTSYIISTDNVINTLIEKIIIKYTIEINNKDENILVNYCNTYDIIEYSYKLQCSYINNILTLSNTYYLDKTNSETIEGNIFTINRPIKKNSKLNEYLKNLEYNNIYYEQTEKIE